MIRNDHIDILVDLALHSSGNRLLVFARKPAPVQATWLGYCSTTGLETMDYRLSDRWLDQPGVQASWYSEETIWLREAYWCYEPSAPTPEVAPPPVVKSGYVTFCSRNDFLKVSPETLDLWLDILLATPESRLILYAPQGLPQETVLKRMGEHGIARERVELISRKQSWEEFMGSYARADIALDPFPYSGWITTCDALWMGVPVVSLAGRKAVGRGGKSILSCIGLPELVAESRDEYLNIAVQLANDLPRLTHLRMTIRDRMANSPMRDAKTFARDLEAAYRTMWRTWCNRR
jgi:predicted O-linked N-acetylglucosamine transferase (SPINDLY family)